MAECINADLCSLLETWRQRVRKLEKAHFKSASACRIYNYSLGIPLVILTTIIASEIYQAFRVVAEAQYPLVASAAQATQEELARLGNESSLALHTEAFIVLVFGLAAPILAAIQTFMRFPERAEAHRTAASRFGLIKHEIEQAKIAVPEDEQERTDLVNRIKTSMVDAMQQSPSAGVLSLWWMSRRIQKEDEVDNGAQPDPAPPTP